MQYTASPTDWGATFLLIFVLLVALIVLAAMIWYLQYWRPRIQAFKMGSSRKAIWFKQGELILWNPGQTFAFLRNKKLAHVGDAQGGFRAIYPMLGEEAIGPILLQSALFNWEDTNVLTRDGQVLAVKVGVWWRVADVEKYVFRIYSDPMTDLGDGNTFGIRSVGAGGVQAGATGLGESRNAGFNTSTTHRIADQWLRVLTESTVRARINSMAVSEVVSAQAMQFLRQTDSSTQDTVSINAPFEAAILEVLGDIQKKSRDFGVEVERLEVQHIQLPKEIQDAINETRIAFLAPIRGEREAEAIRIKLEKLVSVLGKDTVGLNEIMKNFQHANFMTPMTFMQPLFDSVNRKAAEAMPKEGAEPKQLPDS